MTFLSGKHTRLVITFLVMNLMSGYAQIDYATGASTYSIPVFNYSDAKSGLGTAVSLVYTSNQGIRVNQIASNVGLGWQLQAGGEVIRLQHGLPDDQYNPESIVKNMSDVVSKDVIYKISNPDLYNKYYPNGFLYKVYDINLIPKTLAFQPRFPSAATAYYHMPPIYSEDTEQDEFAVNLNGVSKKFVIGRNFEVKFVDGSLAKVDLIKEADNDPTLYGQGILTKIKGFIITDEQGIVYTFNKYELDELFQFGLPAYSTRIQVPTGKYVINKWVLTSIRQPLANREILFNYRNEDWKYIPDISFDITRLKGVSMPNGSTSIGLAKAHTKVQILSEIVFPDNTIVNFLYNTVTRTDLTGSAALSEIETKRMGVRINKVSLDVGYFHGKNLIGQEGLSPLVFESLTNESGVYPTFSQQVVTEAYKYRLALRKVKIWNRDITQSSDYEFEYYRGEDKTDPADAVPSRLSLNRDHSGYYYRNANISTVQTLPNSDIPVTTGIHEPDIDDVKYGLLKTVKSSVPGSTLKFQYKGVSLATSSRYAVLVDRITFTDNQNNSSYAKSYSYPVTLYNEVLSVFDTRLWQVPTGGSEQITVTYRKDDNATMPGALGQMVTSSLLDAGIKGAFKQLGTEAIFNYFANSLAVKIVFYFAGNFISDALTSFFGGNGTSDVEVYTYSNLFIRERNPFPSLLASVIENEVINSVPIMVRRYNYSSISNIQAWVNPWSSKQLTDPGRYGNLIEVINYDYSGNVVAESKYDYEFEMNTLDNNYKSIKYGPQKHYSAPYSVLFNNLISDDWIASDAYNYKTGRAFLTKESTSEVNALEQKKATNYKYNVYNTFNKAIQQTYTLNSDGKVSGTSFRYASDLWDTYTSNTVLNKLKANNRVAALLSEITWYKNSENDPTYFITGIRLNSYDFETLKAADAKVFRIVSPISVTAAELSSFDMYNLPPWLVNIPNDVVLQNSYSGFMLVSVRNGPRHPYASIKYDETSGIPIATIQNATPEQVSYTSFETGAGKDDWQFNDLGLVVESSCVTGSTGFNLLGYNVTRSGLDPTIKYRITLWAKNAGVTVNGSQGMQLVQANGWFLLQFIINNANSLTIGGNTIIDELRLLPVNARMNTSYYDPITHLKMAECDIDNRIVYYEYDSFNRIVLVSDENHDIIKRYCYNYAGQPGNCDEETFVTTKCDHVYAKLRFENYTYSNNQTFADVVVRFYSDEGCTIPCQARDLTINYRSLSDCQGSEVIVSDNIELGTSAQKKVNGWYTCISRKANISTVFPGTCPDCPITTCDLHFALDEGTGYTPVRQRFFNSEMSQSFTKNDCPSGTSPSVPFNYVVPANTYSSYFSAQHADKFARQDILTNGQNAANNAGYCLQPVYCKLLIENIGFGSNIVAYFYSDAACTQPADVNSLTVNYSISGNCTLSSSRSAVASGTSFILEWQVSTSYANPFPCSTCPLYCFENYALAAGGGYIIVN